MSVATAFVHELFEGFWHRLHGYDDPPPRTVPAAADWPEWSHYDPTATDNHRP